MPPRTITRKRKIDQNVESTYKDFRSKFSLVTKARANIWVVTAVVLFIFGLLSGTAVLVDPNSVFSGNIRGLFGSAAFITNTLTPTQHTYNGTIPGIVTVPSQNQYQTQDDDDGTCTRRQPSFEYSGPGNTPGSPVGVTNGQVVNYVVKLRNNDSSACGPTTFAIGHAPHAGVSALFAFIPERTRRVTVAPGALSGNITIPAKPMRVDPNKAYACYNADATPAGGLCSNTGLIAYFIYARHSTGTTQNPVVCSYDSGHRDVFLDVTGGDYQLIRTFNAPNYETPDPDDKYTMANAESFPTSAWGDCQGGSYTRGGSTGGGFDDGDTGGGDGSGGTGDGDGSGGDTGGDDGDTGGDDGGSGGGSLTFSTLKGATGNSIDSNGNIVYSTQINLTLPKENVALIWNASSVNNVKTNSCTTYLNNSVVSSNQAVVVTDGNPGFIPDVTPGSTINVKCQTNSGDTVTSNNVTTTGGSAAKSSQSSFRSSGPAQEVINGIYESIARGFEAIRNALTFR